MSTEMPEAFWKNLFEMHEYRKSNKQDSNEYPIDGITKPENLDLGHLGVRGLEPNEAERIIRERRDLFKIDGKNFRLTTEGQIYLETR